MNFAHIHLILNHIPLLTLPMALLFLLFSYRRNDKTLERFCLIVLILTAATAVPAYLTGEPAEKIVKQVPGIMKSTIHDHEESAEISLVLTCIAGGLAFLTLILNPQSKFKKLSSKALVLLCAIATISLGYTSNLGGRIRHPEAWSSAPPSTQPLDGATTHDE